MTGHVSGIHLTVSVPSRGTKPSQYLVSAIILVIWEAHLNAVSFG